MKKTILFDLDGTLLDTAPDLAQALNVTLQNHGVAPLSEESIRPYASDGSKGLLKLGFGIEETDPTFNDLKNEFLYYYGVHLRDKTTFFPGILQVLDTIQYNQWKWGIVTNKPANFTDPLITHFPPLQSALCVVSGDTLTKRKPDPAPLLHACNRINALPNHCIYIGDAERDIRAGLAAGMKTLLAVYGYIKATDHYTEWGADGLVNEPIDISDWITRLL